MHTLDDAIATAEMLTDFLAKGKKTTKNEGEVSESKEFDGHKAEESHKTERKNGKAAEKNRGKPFKRPCFLCDGPHWTRECPQKKALRAMVPVPYARTSRAHRSCGFLVAD